MAETTTGIRMGAVVARRGTRLFLLPLLFLTLGSLAPVARAVKELNLTITNGLASPDGGSAREVVLINGELGGPTIVVDEAEELKVTVVNELSDPQYTEYGYFDSTSIHWHGFRMIGVPFYDGATQISQCPLRRNQSQQIDFAVRWVLESTDM